MSTIVKLPDAPVDVPQDDERSAVYALLQIYPLEALDIHDDYDRGVTVVMVGVGDWLRNRAREYQERYAKAAAEWEAWDDTAADWSDEHEEKHIALMDKYNLCGGLCEETRFEIVEVEL